MRLLQRIPVLGRLITEDKGQALVFTAVILTAFVGVSGVAVDAGKGYYAWELLNSSTNAAALAGAAAMPNTTTATTYAEEYGSELATSSLPKGYNTNGIMNTVVTTVTFKCLTTVTTDFYASCENSSGGGNGTIYNAVQVKQTAKVPTWIGPLFGMPTFNIQATATASMKGGQATPYNIAVVLDTTSSMTGADDGANNTSNCSTQIQCAELGIQTLLLELYPCQGGGTCLNTSTPIDQVALYVFPGGVNTSMKNDYACNGSNPSIVPYTFANVTPGANQNFSFPAGDNYLVWSFSPNYKNSNNATTLNQGNNLVMAVGGKTGCGAGAPGGEGTYYAQVIYQAQADLTTQSTSNGNANMMIILSDGNATACNKTLATSGGTSTTNTCSGSGASQIVAASGTLNGTGTKTTNPMVPSGCTAGSTGTTCNGYLSPNYPSALGECGQAVAAAQYAASKGTTVYAIGYGTESGGCTTDASYSYTINNGTSGYGGGNWKPGDGPCQAMAAMASATNGSTFFSDQVNGCDSSDTNNVGITSLVNIFEHVGADITSARLIPNGTT